jgi:hypothetical protein
MTAMTAAAVSIAVRCPTAETSRWPRPPKIWPPNTRIAKSSRARERASQVPQITAITMADTTT